MQSASQTKQVKALWVAVLVLALVAVGLLAYIASRPDHSNSEASSAEPLPEPVIYSWRGLSLEEKLKRTSAVVFADLKPANGQLRAIATDVLVLTPGTEIYYRPGQEVTSLSRSPDGITDWGDGAVALLSGSPASIQESYSVRNGRVSGLGDMPVAELKRLALAR